MGLLAPRVAAFASRIHADFEETSLPDWLARITPAPAPARTNLSAEDIARVIWNVLRWNRGRFNNGCFVRSFTRYHFFREAGYPVVFHLGVEDRKGAAEGTTEHANLRSHAWLTLDGEPFLEFEPERFRNYKLVVTFPDIAPAGANLLPESTANANTPAPLSIE